MTAPKPLPESVERGILVVLESCRPETTMAQVHDATASLRTAIAAAMGKGV